MRKKHEYEKPYEEREDLYRDDPYNEEYDDGYDDAYEDAYEDNLYEDDEEYDDDIFDRLEEENGGRRRKKKAKKSKAPGSSQNQKKAKGQGNNGSGKKDRRHRGRQKGGVGAVIGNIVLVIALCVFAYSAFQLFKIYSEYNEGDKEYEKVQNIAIQTTEDPETQEEEFQVDFDALKKINGDTAAWIRFDNPEEINYPVVHCMNNETYLTKTFEANDNKLGALFIDARNHQDMSDYNTIIYGHHMNNGSMFAKLLNYKEKSFWEENKYFYIYTPDGVTHKYEIFAAGVIKDTADNYQLNFASPEEFTNYIAKVKQGSAYDTGVEVGAVAKTVTLSTCTNEQDDERFVVHGVEITE